MDKDFGTRLKQLIDYLYITPHEFSERCGLSGIALMNNYFSGKNLPTISSLNKILNRYPVNKEWLYEGKGNMWDNDYFEARFKSMKTKPTTSPIEKIHFLLDLFECNMNQLAKRTGINSQVIRSIENGSIKSISDRNILYFSNSIKFIPFGWYYN